MQPRANWQKTKFGDFECEMGLFDLCVWANGDWVVDDGQGDGRMYASGVSPKGPFDIVTQMVACEQAYLDLLEKAKRFEEIEPLDEDECYDEGCDDVQVYACKAPADSWHLAAHERGVKPLTYATLDEAAQRVVDERLRAKTLSFGSVPQHGKFRGMSPERLHELRPEVSIEEAHAGHKQWGALFAEPKLPEWKKPESKPRVREPLYVNGKLAGYTER